VVWLLNDIGWISSREANELMNLVTAIRRLVDYSMIANIRGQIFYRTQLVFSTAFNMAVSSREIVHMQVSLPHTEITLRTDTCAHIAHTFLFTPMRRGFAPV
jgi:hypothetical protein